MKLGLFATLLAYGCAQPPAPVESSPPEQPVEPRSAAATDAPAAVPPREEAPEVEPEPAAPPPVLDAPKLETLAEHFAVVAPSAVEDLVVVPGGVAFIQSSEIWLASLTGHGLKKLEKAVDPHGLATDGSWLYWLGHERNGRIDLATGDTSFLPPFAQRGLQRDLAVGDKLYALIGRGQVWRLDGMHLSRVNTHADQQWQSIPRGFGAGNRVVVLPMIDRAEPGVFLWRARVGGKGHRIETNRVKPALWSVRADGSLVFVRGEQVLRLGANSKKPRVLFEEAGLGALCWCGKDVCTFVETAGELRIHGKSTTEARPLAEGLRQPVQVSCSAESVAWRLVGDEGSMMLGMIAL